MVELYLLNISTQHTCVFDNNGTKTQQLRNASGNCTFALLSLLQSNVHYSTGIPQICSFFVHYNK